MTIKIILIIAALAILLLLIIFFKKRKSAHKLPEQAIPAKENKPVNKPPLDAEPKKEPLPEPKVKQPLPSIEPDSKPIVESKTDAKANLHSQDCNENLPQDSMLRRHYLANLRAIIESLNPPRPTDSCLSRHYDSLIISEIEQCLSGKGAIERLICKYEDHKKTLSQQIQEPQKPAEPSFKAEASSGDSVVQNENPKLPEDSVLRRHTITHLKAIAESNN